MNKSKLLLIVAISALCPLQGLAQLDAYEKVIALFEKTNLVLLGERHLSKLDSDFRIELVRHPQFPQRVNDVVIEFGNSLYQDILDAYFIKLENLRQKELSKVWRNTTSTSGVWDSPIYQQFLVELRKVNEKLPIATRIRVVAGGPPIDWGRVEVWEDQLPYMQRGWAAVRKIEREVLSKGRKALVIYGYGHFMRVDDELEEDDNIIRRLESLYPEEKFYAVLPFAKKDGTFLNIEDTLKAKTFPVYIETQAEPFEKWSSKEFFYGGVKTLKDVADALIYFGKRNDERIRSSESFYQKNPEYHNELERRRSLKPRIKRRQSYN